MIDTKQSVRGSTAYIRRVPKNAVDLVVQTPYRMVMLACAPFPWQVNSLGTAIAWLIDGIPRLVTLYMMGWYFIKCRPKDPEEQVLYLTFLLIVILTYFICAWGTDNYGTAMRHRAKIFPMEVCMLTYTYARMRQYKAELYAHKKGIKCEVRS